MARIAPALLALALATLIPGCGGETPPAGEGATTPNPQAAAAAPASPVVARVGDIAITAEEFEAAAQRTAPANGESFTAEERKTILDELVVEKMLYAEAKKKQIDLDPKVQKVMINTLLRQDVYASVRNSDFTDEELQAYFEAHKDEFIVPEKVQIRRIFLKLGDGKDEAAVKKQAEELRARIVKDPESFKDVAQEFSEDPYRRRGGDLGFVDHGGKPGVDPAVVERAFALKVGEVSEPFVAGGGYNIVMNANLRERVERTFEQMKGSVLRKVKQDKYKDLYDSYVGQIRGEYKVAVDDSVVNSVDLKPGRRSPLGNDDLTTFAPDHD